MVNPIPGSVKHIRHNNMRYFLDEITRLTTNFGYRPFNPELPDERTLAEIIASGTNVVMINTQL